PSEPIRPNSKFPPGHTSRPPIEFLGSLCTRAERCRQTPCIARSSLPYMISHEGQRTNRVRIARRLGRKDRGIDMSEPNYEWIEHKVANGVATITFNAPQYGTALGLKGLQEFLDALCRSEARDDVGAVVLTGRGKAFCSGFNLKEIPAKDLSAKDLDVETIAAHFRVVAMWWHQILHLLTRMPKPILAAVNGVAVGSGLGMTLCSDMAVCKDTASFFPAWHTIGIAH